MLYLMKVTKLMIPKIIHQTWRDHNLPVDAALPESWKTHNPDWEYRFWTDADLRTFVKDEYPRMLSLYLAAEKPVQRADIARYLLLHKYGGIYADIDTMCHSSADILVPETRVIFSQEPHEHWCDSHAYHRDMSVMVFNGTIASPAGHPFWLHVMAVLHTCRHATKDLLESTGPLMLSGCVITYAHPQELSLNSCHLFNPDTKKSTPSADPVFGPYGNARISTHLWAGTWSYHNKKPVSAARNMLRFWFYKLRYLATRGTYLSKEAAAKTIDIPLLQAPIPELADKHPNIAILIPVRDGEAYLQDCFALLDRLDYPKDRLKVVFCEGDSTDNTYEVLQELIEKHRRPYRHMELIWYSTRLAIDRKTRSLSKIQKKRRGALARVRNYLLEHALSDEDTWTLWIDVDVCDYPADILHTLLHQNAKIVTPNCVREPGEKSFDLNAFLNVGGLRDQGYYRQVRGGIFQPSAQYFWRRHLHDLRYLNRVPLSSVGGTMLLVHSSVHRAGVIFPDIPYDDLLETEGFGKLACDFGTPPIGLPNVEIVHVHD